MYAVEHLLNRGGPTIEVDVFERLATPWGLVRSGVAPDHPEKKLIADRSFDFSLADPRVRFFGNVEIGAEINAAELEDHYHAAIFAVGAGGDVSMNIAGEDLEGCFAARSFVSFYNGHPDFQHLRFDLSSERVVIVGNGNVALDVARILTTPVSELAKTDITDAALDLLRSSAIREVVLLGRRGPAQAAYNNPELEELRHVPGVDIAMNDVALPDPDTAPVWETRRKLKTLKDMVERSATPGHRRILFHFLASPLELIGDHSVCSLRIGENALAIGADGSLRAGPTGREAVIETRLVFRAIGYRGTPFSGLPFDAQSGTIPNIEGRVLSGPGQPIPGTYVTGWIKRGCQGVIGTNRRCARQTVDHLLDDLACGPDARRTIKQDRPGAVLDRTRTAVVTQAEWRRLDRHEREEGRRTGRPRVKVVDRAAQLPIAMGTRTI